MSTFRSLVSRLFCCSLAHDSINDDFRRPSMKAATAYLLISIMLFLAAVAMADTADRQLIARVEPKYPETLQRLYIGGSVRLKVTIAAKGSVEKVELLGGNPILGQAAMEAVKNWKYAPAKAETTTE